ncbi:MAG TPA: magnesium transporter [Kiritimatiellia bacterium]|nr:magnesium transporter [Kiritimatiellia bacterium]
MSEEQQERKRPVDLAALMDQHPAEVAEIISALKDEEAVELLHRLSQSDKAADALGEMDPEDAARLFSELTREEKTDILTEMAPDDAVDLLEELPEEMVADVLSRLDEEDSEELAELMMYPPDTAGGLMSTHFVAVPANETVEATIETLRKQAEDAETLYYAYVLDEEEHLLGVLALRDLVLARPNLQIRELTRTEVVTLPVDMDAEEVANTFDKLNYLALPVVDGENHLLGIVTVDDVMDRMREETTEDILRMGGIPSGEEHPLEAPVDSVKKRLPWMMANIFFNLVAVIGVAVFEESIATVAFLAVLMPIVSDMGGNVATQAMSVAIRGMATGQVVWGQLLLVLRKEFLGGLINGLVLGLQLCIITYVWRGNIYLGLVAMGALWINTVLAACVGAFFPFLMRRLGFDPAMMSGSIVTTITDLTGFFLFLGLATSVLHLIS